MLSSLRLHFGLITASLVEFKTYLTICNREIKYRHCTLGDLYMSIVPFFVFFLFILGIGNNCLCFDVPAS